MSDPCVPANPPSLARYVEIEAADDVWWAADQDVVLDEIEEFLTGRRGSAETDRVLATVLFTDLVAGIAVHVAARVCSLGDANDVIVTRTIRDLTAGSAVGFLDRGEHELKGIDDSWKLYAVTD